MKKTSCKISLNELAIKHDKIPLGEIYKFVDDLKHNQEKLNENLQKVLICIHTEKNEEINAQNYIKAILLICKIKKIETIDQKICNKIISVINEKI